MSTKANGIFELRIKNDAGKEEVWTIDLKKTGTVYKGAAKPKMDVAIILSDDTFLQLADGKVRFRPLFDASCRPSAHTTCVPARRPESVYDRQVENEGEHDASYEAQRGSKGVSKLP